MGILDQLASGGRTSALDIVKSRTQGRRDAINEQSTLQQLQLQSLKMEEWMNNRPSRKIKRDYQDAQAVQGLELINKDTILKKKKQDSALKRMVDTAEEGKIDYLSRVMGDANDKTWPGIYSSIPQDLKDEFQISPSLQNNEALKVRVVNRTINTAAHRRKKDLLNLRIASKVNNTKNKRSLPKKDQVQFINSELLGDQSLSGLSNQQYDAMSVQIVGRMSTLLDSNKNMSWGEAKDIATSSVKKDAIKTPATQDSPATLNPLSWFGKNPVDATLNDQWLNVNKSPSSEITRVTKDGRKAIFDSNTKEFIRWE